MLQTVIVSCSVFADTVHFTEEVKLFVSKQSQRDSRCGGSLNLRYSAEVDMHLANKELTASSRTHSVVLF